MKSPKKIIPATQREGLQLVIGGRLLRTKWETETKSYATTDVTDNAPCYLFAECEVAEDVILRDIFLLLQKHLEFHQDAIGHHVAEFVVEGLQPSPIKPETAGEKLELSWRLEYDSQEKKLHGNLRPECQCVSKTGERSSIAMSRAFDIAPLPVCLNHGLHILVLHKKPSESYDFAGAGFTLGQILEAILWELSWFGGPKGKQEFEAKIMESLTEIPDGKRSEK